MIATPVHVWFGSVRWFVIGTWFGYLVRSYLVWYVVRKLGTKLIGPVRGRWLFLTTDRSNNFVPPTEPNNIVPKSRIPVLFRTGTVIWFGTIAMIVKRHSKIVYGIQLFDNIFRDVEGRSFEGDEVVRNIKSEE